MTRKIVKIPLLGNFEVEDNTSSHRRSGTSHSRHHRVSPRPSLHRSSRTTAADRARARSTRSYDPTITSSRSVPPPLSPYHSPFPTPYQSPPGSYRSPPDTYDTYRSPPPAPAPSPPKPYSAPVFTAGDVEDVTDKEEGKNMAKYFRDNWTDLSEFGKYKDLKGTVIPQLKAPEIRRVLKITSTTGGNKVAIAEHYRKDGLRHEAEGCCAGGRHICYKKTHYDPSDKAWTLPGNPAFRFHGCHRACKLGESKSHSNPAKGIHDKFCSHNECSACGILRDQLRLDKAGAGHPKDMRGGMGIYLASASSRADPYCRRQVDNDGTILNKYTMMLVVEAALGKVKNTYVEHKGIYNAPSGYDSMEFRIAPKDWVKEEKPFGRYGRWKWKKELHSDLKKRISAGAISEKVGRPYTYEETVVYDSQRTSVQWAILYKTPEFGKKWWKWKYMGTDKKKPMIEKSQTWKANYHKK